MSFLTARLWGCHGGCGSAVGDNGDTAEDNRAVGTSWVSWGHHRGRWGWDDSRGDDGVMGTLQSTTGSWGHHRGHRTPKGMAEPWGHHRGQGHSVEDGTLMGTL